MYLVLLGGTNTSYCSPHEVAPQSGYSGGTPEEARDRPATPEDRIGVAPSYFEQQRVPGTPCLREADDSVSPDRSTAHDSGSAAQNLARLLEVIVRLQR